MKLEVQPQTSLDFTPAKHELGISDLGVDVVGKAGEAHIYNPSSSSSETDSGGVPQQLSLLDAAGDNSKLAESPEDMTEGVAYAPQLWSDPHAQGVISGSSAADTVDGTDADGASGVQLDEQADDSAAGVGCAKFVPQQCMYTTKSPQDPPFFPTCRWVCYLVQYRCCRVDDQTPEMLAHGMQGKPDMPV